MPQIVPSQVVSLISARFPTGSGNLFADHAPTLAGIVRLIDSIPSELLTLEGDDYCNPISGIEALRHMVTMWQAKATDVPQTMGGKRPMDIIRDGLPKCNDQAPSPTTPDLNVVADKALRESIRRDMSSAELDFPNGEWKGATVLAGAATEALLLWAIETNTSRNSLAQTLNIMPKNNRPNGNDPLKWYLSDYIEVSLQLQLINDKTATCARLAKDYRNLVHPGKSQRLGQACTRATALTALAALHHIVNDLT